MTKPLITAIANARFVFCSGITVCRPTACRSAAATAREIVAPAMTKQRLTSAAAAELAGQRLANAGETQEHKDGNRTAKRKAPRLKRCLVGDYNSASTRARQKTRESQSEERTQNATEQQRRF
jgi:hypothetical protein